MATTPDVPAAGRSLSDGRDALVAYLTRQQSAMVAMLPGVRAKDVDAVHYMRIAVRRIRSTLRTFRPAFDRARSEWLRVELRWLAELLGSGRCQRSCSIASPERHCTAPTGYSIERRHRWHMIQRLCMIQKHCMRLGGRINAPGMRSKS